MSHPDLRTDEELVAGCSRQDERALRSLVCRYQSLLLGLARNMLNSREDAEEVAADTFVRLWRHARDYRGECSVKSYLCRIAVNLCRDRLRKQPLSSAAPADACDSPDDRIALEQAMRLLDAESREAIVLHHLNGMTAAEIAHAANVDPAAMRMRLTRARRRLRELLEIHD